MLDARHHGRGYGAEMLSFLTVVVLCQVHLASKGKEDDPDD